MSTVRTIPVDVKDQQGKYELQVPIVAEVIKIIQQANGYSLIGLRDFDGLDFVALIRGNVKPGPQNIGQVSVFMLGGKTGAKGKQYSGFFNPNDPLPPEFIGKRPPVLAQPAPKASGGGIRGGGNAPGKSRGFALSYAKDLCVAGIIAKESLAGVAKSFDRYLETGEFAAPQPVQQVQQQFQQQQQPPQERVVPEQGEAPYGGNQGEAPYGGPQEQEQVSEFEQAYGTGNGTGDAAVNKGPTEDIPF